MVDLYKLEQYIPFCNARLMHVQHTVVPFPSPIINRDFNLVDSGFFLVIFCPVRQNYVLPECRNGHFLGNILGYLPMHEKWSSVRVDFHSCAICTCVSAQNLHLQIK